MSYECDGDMIKVIYGDYIDCYNAWSKDKTIRHVSASGGIITSIINYLLKNRFYDVAFCVDTYDYKEQLVTMPITRDDLMSDWENSNIPKSRYLPVSHENAILYIKQNEDKKVVLIGTSCAIKMFRNVIYSLKLQESNYLLIGLFCDRVFNYNIEKYFEDSLCRGKTINHFHFKNKESGGWPGNMKFYLDEGEILYKDKSERTKVKDYFMPERCMYCVDKLNVCADISVGDNYTDQNSNILGSNSVIIRTTQGLEAWNIAKGELEYERLDIDKLHKAQYLEGRLHNLYYSILKENIIKKELGVETFYNHNASTIEESLNYKFSWRTLLKRIRVGQLYDSKPDIIHLKLREDNKRAKSYKKIINMAERRWYLLIQFIMRIFQK